MALFGRDGFGEDAFIPVPDGEPVPTDRPAIVSKTRWLAQRDQLGARNAPLGLMLEAGEDLDGIEADVGRFALVALRFPRYTDGRAYSTARLLRERHAFAGELRAVGDVLHDQIPFMRRCGFDSFEITHEPTIRALREGRVRGVAHHYQPAAVPETAPGPRWRRVRAG
ncbi:DUF934 domain-containing protein [Alsobacter sp. R-9]